MAMNEQPQALFQSNLRQPQQIPEYIRSGFQNEWLGYKQGWQDAENQINRFNNYLTSGAGNENERQQAQAAVEYYRQRQRDLANSAEMSRNAARSLGMDTAGFDADNTLAQSQQNLQINNARAVRDLLNIKPVGVRQEEYYNQMRAAGLSPRLAQIAAEERHGQFREENKQKLWDGIMSYGLGADGAVNELGGALLARLNAEDPYGVELFTKEFALPQNRYAEANQNYRQNLVLDAQNRQQENQLRNAWNVLQSTQLHDTEERDKDRQLNLLKSALSNTGVKPDQMEKELNFLTQMIGDRQKAAELYLYQHYDKALKSSDGDKKNFFNFTDGYFGMIEYYLKSEKNDLALRLIGQLQDSITNGEFKYAEQADSARIQMILTELDMLSKVANGEMTLEEYQRAKQGDRHNTNKANYDSKANEEAKKIGEAKARELQEQEARRQEIEQNRRNLKFVYPDSFSNPIVTNPNAGYRQMQPRDFQNNYYGGRTIINP